MPKMRFRSRVLPFLRKHVFPLAVLIAIFTCLRSSLADWNDVPSGSMNPSIIEGDRIFVNKLAFGLRLPLTDVWLARWSAPKRGDIVTCASPVDGTRLVKRVVAVPGDTIEMHDDVLRINGQIATYQPTTLPASALPNLVNSIPHVTATETVLGRSHSILILPSIRAKRSFAPITVPPGKYLMIGDNRDNSYDSRYWGFVDESEIPGRAVGVVFSLDYDDHYLPRSDRFFKPLH